MDVFFRVGDRDLFLFRVVLEVVMIASGSRKVPTVLLQHLDDLPAAPTLGRTTTKSIPESMSAAPRRTIISRVSPFSIIPDGCGENSSSFFRWSSGRKCTERFAERRIMRVTTDVSGGEINETKIDTSGGRGGGRTAVRVRGAVQNGLACRRRDRVKRFRPRPILRSSGLNTFGDEYAGGKDGNPI